MNRLILLGLVAAAVGAALFLLLRGGGPGGSGGGALTHASDDEGEAETFNGPNLQGSPGQRRPKTGEQQPAPAPPPAKPEADEVLLRVRVLDDATGEPLVRALVWPEPAKQPCPRLPAEERLFSGRLASDDITTLSVAGTDREGRAEIGSLQLDTMLGFSIDGTRPPRPTKVDVFAKAPGYVLGLQCAVALPGEVTLRLKRGLALRGTVQSAQGKPLASARVQTRPGPKTPPIPGHAGETRSDERGQFALEGLLAGAHDVTILCDGFFPLTVSGEDPSDDRARAYVLAPAFVLKFRLRTDDGRDLLNPTVHLRTATKPPLEILRLLPLTDDANADGRLSQGVAVPANSPTVSIEVKADGYAAWVRPEEPVPPEGGERVLAVTLGKDTGQGSLKVLCEDESGQHQKYADLAALPPTILALDRQNVAGGVVIETGDDLRFPSLPPGRYRIQVRTFPFAPGAVDAAVSGGGETEARLVLRPTAKLRVRFNSAQARIVRFRLVQGTQMVPAIPEKTAVAPRTEQTAGDEPVLAAGEGGVLLGGLATGSYVVEVLNEDLRSSRTPVSLREGDTEEVEIRVEPR